MRSFQNTIISTLIVCFFSATAFDGSSQSSVCQLHDSDAAYGSCFAGYSSPLSSGEITSYIDELLKSIGLMTPNFSIRACPGIENAVAFISDGERRVLIDELFFRGESNEINNWTEFFILSHEIGHHLNGHTLSTPPSLASSRKRELEADYFAGFAIGSLGGGEDDIRRALQSIPHRSSNTSTHPIFEDRFRSAMSGFHSSSGIPRELRPTPKVQYLNTARIKANRYIENGSEIELNSSIRNYEMYLQDERNDDEIFLEFANLLAFSGRNSRLIELTESIDTVPNEFWLMLYEAQLEEGVSSSPMLHDQLSSLSYNELIDVRYRSMFAHYLSNSNQKERAIQIFESLFSELEERQDDFEFGSYLVNYSYVLLATEDFENASLIAGTATQVLASTHFAHLPELKKLLGKAYYNKSVALLNLMRIDELGLVLQEWNNLGFDTNEERCKWLYFRARWYEELGDFELAIMDWQQCQSFNSDPFATFHLGRCLEGVHRLKEACYSYRRACEDGNELSCRYLRIKCNE